MVEIKRDELMKNRGYGAILLAALRMLGGNLRAVIRHQWAFSLAYSAVTAYIVINAIHSLRADVAQFGASWAELCVMAVLLLATGVAFYGRAAMLIDGQPLKYNVVRTVKLYVVGLVLCIIVYAVVVGVTLLMFRAWGSPSDIEEAQRRETIYIGVLLLMAIVAALSLLPFIFVAAKYYMEPSARLRKVVTSGYRRGARHFGCIFITWLLVGIVSGVVFFVVSLPMLVLILALGMSVGGALMGDEPGLPGYFYPMMYAVCTLTCFIVSAILLYQMFVAYYMYGTIETRTEERARMAKV